MINQPSVPPVKVITGKLKAQRIRYRKASRIVGMNMITARESARINNNAMIALVEIFSLNYQFDHTDDDFALSDFSSARRHSRELAEVMNKKLQASS